MQAAPFRLRIAADNRYEKANSIELFAFFFPAEAKTAKAVLVQVIEKDTGRTHVLTFAL